MLRTLKVRSFKSLKDQEIHFSDLTVLFGPNAAGKSNVLDAIQALSRIATERTLTEALSAPIRGYPIEAFSFPPGGLPELLSKKTAHFRLEADLNAGVERYSYEVEVQIQTGSGSLSVRNECLRTLTKSKGEPQGRPRIETETDRLLIRSRSRPGRPREEPVGLNHTKLSDPRLGGPEYLAIERCRTELSGWRTYYLDPRVAMREARPPMEATDIGVLGEAIAPFLYRLRGEREKNFHAIRRALRSIIPNIDNLDVDLDSRRGTLDINIRQSGIEYSSRIISEGTLRVLALCSIAANPWGGTLLAFEEPENGVHPRRIELVARLLLSISAQSRQVIVTTHSPLFCSAVIREARSRNRPVALLRVSSETGTTEIRQYDPSLPLFVDHEIAEALKSASQDGHFESLMLSGLLDA